MVVDDEAGVRSRIRDFLEIQGFEVEEAEGCQGAEEAFEACRPDVVIVDYSLPDGDALALLQRLKEIDQTVPLVTLTAQESIELAVRAIHEGPDQFLTKPVQLPTLLIILQRLLHSQRIHRVQQVRMSRPARERADPFLGTSAAIRNLAEQARKVLSTDSPVLIQGETGIGKGVLARWLHSHGPRREESFVDLNCAGLSREFLETELFGHQKGAFTGAIASKTGLLELADRGAVFLDEIADMDLQVQPKLLTVLEEKRFRRMGDVQDLTVDVHIIAATHEDLGILVRDSKFRSDLYFRISTIPLYVPPLRDRVEDIPVLARHLVKRCADDQGRGEVRLSAEVEEALMAYPWPGNVRELRNILDRAVLLSDSSILGPKDLHFDVASEVDKRAGDSTLTLEELERRHIGRVLLEEHGHVAQAARRLGVPRSSLYQKIKRLGIALSKF